MKIPGSKTFVMRHGSQRLIAFLCFVIGTIAVWNLDVQPNPAVFNIQREKDPPTREAILKSILESRDLSAYEIGKTFSNCTGAEIEDYKQCEKDIDNGRENILINFEKKQRSYVIYEWSGVDSGTAHHIFIEPDNFGSWQVVIRWEPQFSYRISFETAVSIERKLISKDDPRPRDGKYYLSFIDKNGKEVFRL